MQTDDVVEFLVPKAASFLANLQGFIDFPFLLLVGRLVRRLFPLARLLRLIERRSFLLGFLVRLVIFVGLVGRGVFLFLLVFFLLAVLGFLVEFQADDQRRTRIGQKIDRLVRLPRAADVHVEVEFLAKLVRAPDLPLRVRLENDR